MMKYVRIIRRLVRNLDVFLTEAPHNAAATNAGIANQADMIRRKFDALTRVMYELREIQKAQLAMQRQASDMIRQLAAGSSNPPSSGKDSEP